jgi:hypothetical protein
MPQIIAGQGADLTKTVAVLVKELLENNWPVAAYDPLKADIGFGIDTWDDYGDVDIHVNPNKALSRPFTLGWGYTKVRDSVTIHVFVRASQGEVPSSLGSAERKIEEIIKDNAAALGQGVPMLFWEGWDREFIDNNLKDIWHAVGRATAIYWKVKT